MRSPIVAVLIAAMLVVSLPLLAQDYKSFTAITHAIANVTPASAQKLWSDLLAMESIPLVREDSVAFLYKGEAKTVAWMGDFNGWGYDKKFNNKGKRIAGTDIWMLKARFPRDARLDYKIVIDDINWILDPLNPDQQWSGVGGGSPNTELRMPYWKEDPITSSLIAGAKRGRVEKDVLLKSEVLGYQLSYSVYLPPDYNQRDVYPVIYITDGYEYMHEQMGNIVVILDNLIHLKKIKPVVAVLIDHREPAVRSNNRRMRELAMNSNYLTFVTDELIPAVEHKYTVSTDPAQRAILGTSMGGLTAAYFAFSKPDIFGLAGIQSPAFWFKPDIYTFCDNPTKPPVKTFLTTGRINDTEEGAVRMRNLLEKNTCTFEFREVNQGHSWGNWRDLTDDILIYFFPVN